MATEIDYDLLPARIVTNLKKFNFKFYGQLVRMLDASRVLSYRNVGRTSLFRLLDSLRGLGLSLGMNVPFSENERSSYRKLKLKDVPNFSGYSLDKFEKEALLDLTLEEILSERKFILEKISGKWERTLILSALRDHGFDVED